jgi:hypothetical protein
MFVFHKISYFVSSTIARVRNHTGKERKTRHLCIKTPSEERSRLRRYRKGKDDE